VTDKEDFIEWTQRRLREAETALHNGDAEPRLALWSSREPVSVLGARRSATGRVRRLGLSQANEPWHGRASLRLTSR
jgi:hypothetical protein